MASPIKINQSRIENEEKTRRAQKARAKKRGAPQWYGATAAEVSSVARPNGWALTVHRYTLMQ